MSSPPVLSLRGVMRSYPSGGRILEVLKGADLDIFPGEMVGLIGPSGSGKSSLLHAAGLLEHPNAGEIVIEGRDCSKLNERARTKVRLGSIGFVYQFHHLLPEFSALDNVAMPLRIAGKSRKEARARAASLLEQMGLAERGLGGRAHRQPRPGHLRERVQGPVRVVPRGRRRRLGGHPQHGAGPLHGPRIRPEGRPPGPARPRLKA
jgi:predicted ABC-type transport system involved in lysophospholipase L1 biosynthesis ATPase subunit